MTSVLDFDVVICGAGVGGMTLAAMLGRCGLQVLLVEKQRQYRMMHKGELVQPRSLAILSELDLLTPLSVGGALEVNSLACRTADGDALVSLDYRLLAGPFRHGLVQSYREMLTTLAEQLGPTVTVWRGSRVESLVHDPDERVSGVLVDHDGAVVQVKSRLTVAGDGHASKLRKAASIEVAARRYTHQMVGFEIEDAPPLGRDMNAHLTGSGLRALFELPGDRARLYVQIPSESFREVGRAGLPVWTDALLRSMPALESVADPLRRSLDSVQVLSAWRFISPRWTKPGFSLLGDAAHCVHPMVGQGMNAAIGDAWELGSQLADLPSFDPGPLDAALLRYEAKRRPCLNYVARLSHNMATLLTSTSRTASVLRPCLLRRNQSNLRLQRRITQNMAGLTAQPLQVRDWISTSGLLNGALGPAGGQPTAGEPSMRGSA